MGANIMLFFEITNFISENSNGINFIFAKKHAKFWQPIFFAKTLVIQKNVLTLQQK